jgi:D-alanyl-D-alanine carboxypeptidase.
MASRKLEDLHPDLQHTARQFVKIAEQKGIDVLIYCTWRSPKEQDELYEIGRSKPGRIVTNARAGQSAHNNTIDGKPAALAFDCVPMINGKPQWSPSCTLWQILGDIGSGLGLDWYGKPAARFREFPHFEMKL